VDGYAHLYCLSERLDGFCSYSVFSSSFILGVDSVNLIIPAPKTGVLNMVPPYKMAILSKTAVTILIQF
jgi:hypothetical protein